MKSGELVSVIEFCSIHNAEVSFVSSLKESGLVDFVLIDGEPYVHVNYLSQLEKMVRFHYDLDINLEGIETILTLLNRMDQMQHQINYLEAKLRLLEEGEEE